MTDNDIVKALEICQKAKHPGDCEYMGCPARTKQGCRFYSRTDEDEDHDMFIPDEMFNAVLDLINHQKAENERLIDLVNELGDYNVAWVKDNHDLRVELKTAKSEAIREFAERLKAKRGLYGEIWESDIDNTVEEMTEETV